MTENSDIDQLSRSGLFTPFTHGSLRLRNRFAMAPMTRVKSPGGTPTAEGAAYYRARAAAEVGLIITEGIYIDHPEVGRDTDQETSVPRLSGEARVAGWRTVVDAVHAEGSAILAQIWHTGAHGLTMEPTPDMTAVGPSTIAPGEGSWAMRGLTLDELGDITRAYADAARNAQLAGFDGVEIHGAHGYLLDQFLWHRVNRRTDGYGGSLGANARFPAEVVAAVRAATGPDFTIGFRFSQWKAEDYTATLARNPGELAELLTPLVDAGVDIMHASTRRFWTPAFPDQPGEDGGRGLAGWTKKLTGLPTVTVGSVGLATTMQGDPHPDSDDWADELRRRFDREEFDVVALGRTVLTDPAWLRTAGITTG
ncbi:12-oxophytodienoate reductase [Pseudonocardia spinosispora]|uniref:oxidoreductase n=1 Tax=Pseudonocardia spinosispora TaxID=103441 RepID=UPI0003F758A6|nr:12-oxophytodienoate reductase [Pseudonocardia spinosispora]